MASPHTPADETPQLGLRERKKLKTRIAIRRATYALIAEQGYDATTIEQIAEAAEVSSSTVFRYFPTKEDIVLTDEYDPVMEAVLRGRPAGEPPLESLRFVITEVLRTYLDRERDEMIRRTRLMVDIPAVRARMTETMSATAILLTRALADRTGRAPDDLELRIFTAAVLGALREVTIYWGERGFRDDLIELVERALDTMKGGLAL
ncbi:TetR family transcriptional regulator [Streptomyces sp. A3M-1-3]|uniref:TetR/AcrR family transcriptional regulator n=1 Tax=Streptomyces sp. A3M-1-3 TaxID=2962044 RepID=UPI0020B76CC6|nr:TetR family transcriptional regulator [Streptomyces sp. A3M-1-3]MCP3819031.1 TetR family transcriptional regulator [Streptomyces sp. A3M-1-3]